ncbi:MAG: hypothetical protein K2X27_09205 [Candidatus Obscuribacterales bacterium]|nr:hypothetical protein [Candidatus Obscuribacterales bacterium]
MQTKIARWCLCAILSLSLFSAPAAQIGAFAAAEDNQYSEGEFSKSYTELTKKVLLAGIAIERFSLNYRKETAREAKFRKLRFFAAQEAGAGCGLAFEIIGLKQFGLGRKRPLELDKGAVKGATVTAMTGSIIAGSGSLLELASNIEHSFKLKKLGYDSKTANKYVSSKLQEIDKLLQERANLVAANANHPAYQRALVEGKILTSMRSAFVNEYAAFHNDTNTNRAFQNLFFILNASYNAMGATAAGLAYKAVETPVLNGPANILFIISGATAMATPFVSSGAGLLARKLSAHGLEKDLKEKVNFNPEEFAAQRRELESLSNSSSATGTLIPSLPATERLSLYTESGTLFRKQIESESRTMRELSKVALETSFLAPAIGSLLMTQGIFGTHGYFDYATKPRKQLDQFYRGSVCGTVGTGLAVVGNAAWFLASLSYEHSLKKKENLPEQLINKRLQHLDEMEKLVQAL